MFQETVIAAVLELAEELSALGSVYKVLKLN